MHDSHVRRYNFFKICVDYYMKPSSWGRHKMPPRQKIIEEIAKSFIYWGAKRFA